MPTEITAGIKSGRLKEINLTQAECYSRNEQMLQLMREGRLNIKSYWDKDRRKVVFGLGGTQRKMKKEEFIKKYGEERYEKFKEQISEWRKKYPASVRAHHQNWGRKHSRKDGQYHKEGRTYQTTGIPHAKNIIRSKHRDRWRQFKQIIAPESQIHHEWISGTSNYTGVALVEKDQHMHGFIDVIQILEGEITPLTEAAIAKAR